MFSPEAFQQLLDLDPALRWFQSQVSRDDLDVVMLTSHVQVDRSPGFASRLAEINTADLLFRAACQHCIAIVPGMMEQRGTGDRSELRFFGEPVQQLQSFMVA